MDLNPQIKARSYSEINLRAVPTYPVAEVARYLGVSASALRSWFKGRKGYQAVLTPDDPAGKLLSFTNLVEASILAGLRKRYPRMRIAADILPAVEYMRTLFGQAHPLADGLLSKTDGKSLLYEHISAEGREVINASRGGQVEFDRLVDSYTRRVEVDASGVIYRYFPMLPAEGAEERRTIAVSPQVAFGQPVIFPGSIPTRIISNLWKAGDSAEGIAEDFGCSVDLIRDALLFENVEETRSADDIPC